jgi:hypothetical protein
VSDTLLYEIECVVFVTLLVGFGLALAVRRLGRTRPELSIGTPLAVGVGVRLLAIVAVSVSGVGTTLRGGDELKFLMDARTIAASSFDSDLWLPISESHRLHQVIFALQIKLGDFPDMALRMTQVGIALLGIVLIVAAIYDVAGPRAARLGMWVLALEPAGVFFNSILHREPLLVLASGLVVFGGAKIWTKLELRGVLLLGLGCAIAVATRPYAAWSLMTGGLLLILFASLRQVGTRLRSIPLIYAVAIAVAVAAPAVLSITSQDSLENNLQRSQDANTAGNLARGAAASNNLSLERVDFSSRSDLITNLPRRIRDVLLRPYPWQTANTSQRLGAIGTLVALAALVLLWRYARRNRGQVLAVAAPFIFPAFFLLLAYALSVGNAGTGFRYRTHLVLLGLATLVVLREHALRRDSSESDEQPHGDTVRPERAMSDVIRHPQPLASGGRRE